MKKKRKTGVSRYYKKAVLSTLEELGYDCQYVMTTVKSAYEGRYE